MNDILQDVRYALRQLARSPGFTIVALLTLAIGLGANTLVFSWIQGLVLAPLRAVPEQDRLLVVTGEARDGSLRSTSVPDLRDLQKSGLPVSIVGFDMQRVSLTAAERPEQAWGSVVSGDFFDVLGVRAVAGRTFRPEEDGDPGAHPVVVLSHGFWQRRFQGDPKIIGQPLSITV
jgi:hypothetical protein